MLDESYYRKTDEIIARYVQDARSLIPIMQDIQAEYRYLPGELLSYMAEKIGITETKAYSVATFYENFSFEPKGKYVIKVCDGTGVIFGVTGGVTEAVLRRLTEGHASTVLKTIAESGIRGAAPIKEVTVPYNGMDVKICVVSGLANARKVMEQVKSGEKEYHLIEVMACRHGCIMGGGQPLMAEYNRERDRALGLYAADNATVIKKANENPLMEYFYSSEFKGKTHELLHVPHLES